MFRLKRTVRRKARRQNPHVSQPPRRMAPAFEARGPVDGVALAREPLEGRSRPCREAFGNPSDERIVLDFLRERPDPEMWSVSTLHEAGAAGNVALLRVLRQLKPFDVESRAAACTRCVRRGHSPSLVLEYLAGDRGDYTPHPEERALCADSRKCAEIMGHIARLDRTDLLDLLQHERFAKDPWVQRCTFFWACQEGKLATLRWLVRHGWHAALPLYPSMVQGGHLECLQFLHSRGFPLYPSIMEDAAYSDNVQMLKWLHEKGCAVTSEVRKNARERYRAPTLMWLDGLALA